eukprot:g29194.t1
MESGNQGDSNDDDQRDGRVGGSESDSGADADPERRFQLVERAVRKWFQDPGGGLQQVRQWCSDHPTVKQILEVSPGSLHRDLSGNGDSAAFSKCALHHFATSGRSVRYVRPTNYNSRSGQEAYLTQR